jgi:hypothetical protein
MFSAGNSVQSVNKTLRHPSRKKDRKLFLDKTNRFNILKRKNILNSENRDISQNEIQLIKAKLSKQRKKEKIKNLLLFIISIFVTIFILKILFIPFKQVL